MLRHFYEKRWVTALRLLGYLLLALLTLPGSGGVTPPKSPLHPDLHRHPYAKTCCGWPYTFFKFFFKNFLGPLGGPWGSCPLFSNSPSPATCPHIFSDVSKKSHPEEIPRKKSKAQDLLWLAPYYVPYQQHEH